MAKRLHLLLTLFQIVILVVVFLLVQACVSHLKEAKLFYAQGEEFARSYQTHKAVAAFKRALQEAEREAEKDPSSQAYMLKGMAELNLEMWEEAKESFLRAHSFGFEKGEEWASQLTLFGLATTLQEMGLKEPAARVFKSLLDKSKFDPVTRLAAQSYVKFNLDKAIQIEGVEKDKILKDLLKTTDKLIAKNFGSGFGHYLQSQVFSHLSVFDKSFESAVIAKEIGLPTEQIGRDNDNQIVFCYRKLKETLDSASWGEFELLYQEWMKRWGWEDPERPPWRKR
jgi:tetratricopeptide (TPR) repeat protein